MMLLYFYLLLIACASVGFYFGYCKGRRDEWLDDHPEEE